MRRRQLSLPASRPTWNSLYSQCEPLLPSPPSVSSGAPGREEQPRWRLAWAATVGVTTMLTLLFSASTVRATMGCGYLLPSGCR